MGSSVLQVDLNQIEVHDSNLSLKLKLIILKNRIVRSLSLSKLLIQLKNFGFTPLLLLVVIGQLVFIALSPNKTETLAKEVQSKLNPSDYLFVLSSSLNPEGMTMTSSNNVKGVSTKANTSSNSKAKTSSSKSSKSVSPKEEPYSEEKISTVESRDEDRSLIVEEISDKIAEYNFFYNKLPNVYRNKSKSELTENGSSIIYFYNNDENRTNARAYTLGTESKGYIFFRVLSCNGTKSFENKIFFIYKDFDLFLCKEDGSVERFWVAN